MKLTPDHLAVLKAIDRLNKGAGTPATALLIDWAYDKLRALSDAGLIESVGSSNTWTKWTLTDDGKRVLAKLEGH